MRLKGQYNTELTLSLRFHVTLDARGLLARQRRGASERVLLVGDWPSRLRRSILSSPTRKKPLAPRVFSCQTADDCDKSYFNSLLSVWKYDETLSFVPDILLETTISFINSIEI